MTRRDEELDAVQRDLARPFLHEPDEKRIEAGGACFLNMDRLCGPDCTAYLPHGPTAPDRCSLLSSLQGLVELGADLVTLGRPRPAPVPNIPPPNGMPRSPR